MEAHIPRHRDSKTKNLRHRDSKTKKPRHRDSETKKPRHREMETNKPRHRDSKAFFRRTKSHDIEIPKLVPPCSFGRYPLNQYFRHTEARPKRFGS